MLTLASCNARVERKFKLVYVKDMSNRSTDLEIFHSTYAVCSMSALYLSKHKETSRTCI
jgi:hypothetical protein